MELFSGSCFRSMAWSRLACRGRAHERGEEPRGIGHTPREGAVPAGSVALGADRHHGSVGDKLADASEVVWVIGRRSPGSGVVRKGCNSPESSEPRPGMGIAGT